MPLDSERINLGGVLVWDEGTKESYRKFGTSKAVRTVLCYWNQRNTLINALFGFGGINVTEQQQYQPDTPYPDAPSLLFVSEMDTIGIAGPGGLTTDGLGLVAYKYARVQITYSSLPYNQNNLNVVSLDFGVKEISIPGQVFKYKDTGNAVPAEAFPALRVVTVTITIQQFNQPVLPMSVVTSVAGYVNASDFLGLPRALFCLTARRQTGAWRSTATKTTIAPSALNTTRRDGRRSLNRARIRSFRLLKTRTATHRSPRAT